MKKLGGSLAMLACLSGCASMIEGQTQNVSLSTNPPANVMCDASNDRGAWKLSPIQGSVSSIPVKRSQSRLVVTCKGDGYQGEVTNKAEMEAWAAMNFLWGLSAPIAFLVDAGTGALFSYDDAISVPLKAKIAADGITAPAPVVDNAAPAPVVNAAPAPVSAVPATNGNAPVAASSSATYQDLVASGAIVEAPSAQRVK